MIKAITVSPWSTIMEYDLDRVEFMEIDALYSAISRERQLDRVTILSAYRKLRNYGVTTRPRIFIKMIISLLGIVPEEKLVEEVIDKYTSVLYSYKPRILDDAEYTLKYLKDRGIKIAIVANTHLSARTIARFLGNVDLLKYIDYVVSSADVGFKKPNPKIFQVALRALRVDPVEVIHIGDSCIGDVIGARISGIKPILIARCNASIELCRKIPQLKIIWKFSEVINVLRELGIK